jgi:RNA polymerase sigma-70 factor, ECF subfamily
VCAVPGVEAAAALEVSVAALKSLLQRARARLEEHTASDEQLTEPTDSHARRLLDRYMAAFENSDMPAITRLLADDTVLEMTGTTTWYSGRSTCLPFIAAQGIGRAGDWRMLPLHVNGQLGAASYRLGAAGGYHPFAIVVLATTATQLRRITLFGEPTLFELFALPATMS